MKTTQASLAGLFGLVGVVTLFLEDHPYHEMKEISNKASKHIEDDVVKRDIIPDAVSLLGAVVNELLPELNRHYPFLTSRPQL